jgi:thioredoxin 1
MSKLKVMDFNATWCGPCRTLAPIIKDLMDEYGDGEKSGVIVEKIDVDENRDLAEKYSIRSIPTIIFEKDGEVLERVTGLQSKAVLVAKIDSYTK